MQRAAIITALVVANDGQRLSEKTIAKLYKIIRLARRAAPVMEKLSPDNDDTARWLCGLDDNDECRLSESPT